MSIIVDENTKVLIQGITGNVGKSFARKMIEDGTNLVGGVTPGKGGENVFGIPVFNSMEEALRITEANISLVVVPAPFLKDAALEALYYGIKRMVVYTENVPVHDEIDLVHYARSKDAILLGPNSPGLASSGKANVSDFNSKYLRKGKIGIISKSGTLNYEVMDGLNKVGLGISTFVVIGGDRIPGITYNDLLPLFEDDPESEAVILGGEIGGMAELEVIPYIKKMTKPVFAYIAGQAIPRGKKMGHAGAIVSGGGEDSAQAKMKKLKEAGVGVANIVTDIPKLLAKYFLNK